MGLIRDFNADGHLDIAIPDNWDHTLRIFMGDGQGQFSAGTVLSVGVAASTVEAADFDLDGDLDLAVTHYAFYSGGVLYSGPQQVYLFAGDGQGGFSPAGSLSQPDESFRVRAADINADGKPDVVVSLNGYHTFRVYLGNGNFSFGPAKDFSTGGQYPHDLLVLDINQEASWTWSRSWRAALGSACG